MELKNSSNLLFRSGTGSSSLKGKNLPNTSLKLWTLSYYGMCQIQAIVWREREREREGGACEEFGLSTQFVHVDFEQWLGR